MEQERKKHHNALIFFTFVIAIVAVLFFVQTKNIQEAQEEKLAQEEAHQKMIAGLMEDLELEAKSIAIYNITQNKSLYTKNTQEVMPLASLVKTMTAIVALSGQEDEVVISKNALNQTGDASLYLGQIWEKKDLIKLMLVASSNDAAKALEEQDSKFLEKMNMKAKKLGMERTRFLNTTGLDQTQNIAGAYGTAEDANTLAAFALKYNPELFSTTVQDSIYLLSKNAPNHEVVNTNSYLEDIPNIIFSKTGATNLAGGNLTVIFKNAIDEDIVITVLASSLSGRFNDVEKIAKALYNI